VIERTEPLRISKRRKSKQIVRDRPVTFFGKRFASKNEKKEGSGSLGGVAKGGRGRKKNVKQRRRRRSAARQGKKKKKKFWRLRGARQRKEKVFVF